MTTNAMTQKSKAEPFLRDLNPADWELLLRRIDKKQCTPFLGAGACFPTLKLGTQIAKDWVEDLRKRGFPYPWDDISNLPRVAQYVALRYDTAIAKDEFLEMLFENTAPPKFEGDEPHWVLAGLPFPIYITTNYDDYMIQALEKRGKNPTKIVCSWNESKPSGTAWDHPEDDCVPTPDEPVVFYLHGSREKPESILLTENEYINFLVAVSKHVRSIPCQISEALAQTSLLFIGYSLQDWNFRVLFNGLVTPTDTSRRRKSFTLQFANKDDPATVQEYIEAFCNEMEVVVYWGTAQNFAQKLEERWNDFKRPVALAPANR